MGMYITAAVVVTFTVMAGMMSIVTVDIFNGIIITAGVLFALPYMVYNQGGIGAVMAKLPADHTTLLGGHNPLWVFGVAMPTFLLILGESGMYQKFFAAKNAKAARRAVVGMLAGIVIIETTLALLAIVGRAAYPDLMTDTSILGRAASETVILYMARHGLPVVAGALLLSAAIAIVLSTGNTFLLVPSTNVSRDLYERFINPGASDGRKLLVQRLSIVAFGIMGIILLDYFPTVLSMALYAYSLVGASLTPALMAAFVWRRVTAEGGMACIAGGLFSIIGIKISSAMGFDFTLTLGGTAFDFASSDYIVMPGVIISTSLLIVVSLLTSPSPREKWEPFFTPPGADA
jgi:SSS family solute:Na+ symporter